MKNFFILLCFILIVITAFGQDQPEQTKRKKGYIGISVGVAIPVDDFKSVEIENNEAGFARTGFNYQLINFGYPLTDNFGIAAMWTGASFKIDEEELRTETGLGNLNMETEPWKYGAIMGGLLICIPSDAVSLDLRMMLGLGYARSPEMKITGMSLSNLPTSVMQQSSKANALAFDLGIGLRFNLSRSICLNFLADYMNCKPKFEIDVYNGATYIGSDDFEQPMNHITLTAGLGVRL